MKKILFVAYFPPPIHGLSKAVDTLYNSIIKKNYDIYKIDISSNYKIIGTLLKLLYVRTDVVYFTISQSKWGNLRDLLLLAFIYLKGVKCIIHLHGGYYDKLMSDECNYIQRKLNVCLMSKVNKGIVLGSSLIKVFRGYIPAEKIRVVPNCIDDEFILQAIDEKTEMLTMQNKIHVVYLSNFIKEKGYREVLEVARIIKVRGREKDFVFHFAGKFFDMSEQLFFEKYIEREGLSNIDYHGIVLAEEKNKLLKKGNVMILLTRYPSEGQPISLLEGMGNGMAIVTTNHSGIPDIVTEHNGYICDKNNLDLEKIADFLEKCFDDRYFLTKICKINHSWVKSNFTESEYIDKMNKVFMEVLDE